MESFIKQYYATATNFPTDLLLPVDVEDTNILEQWLLERNKGKKVYLAVPQRGEKRKIMQRVNETANEQLTLLQAQWAADTHKQEQALAELQSVLHLKEPPNRIECFDISTLQGTATVASRVVFVQGVPRKSEYRRFNIKTIETEQPDDFQSMVIFGCLCCQ